jgi:hypothetical protein
VRLLPLILAGAALSAALASPASAQSQADIAESIAGLEMGDHTLTGRPGATRTALADAGKRKGLFSRGPKTERVYTHNQTVVLWPYTRLVEAIVVKNNGSPFLVTSSLGELGQYSARTLTDADGVFHFRGLKPGRYLLSVKVPYEAAITVREDTGRTRTETTFQTSDGYNITSADSVTSKVYDYRNATSEFEHHVFKIVEVKADSAVTAIGEMQ